MSQTMSSTFLRGLAGSLGSSGPAGVERLPTERAITGQVRAFKAVELQSRPERTAS